MYSKEYRYCRAGGTRTHTHKAPDPKSGASTNSATARIINRKHVVIESQKKSKIRLLYSFLYERMKGVEPSYSAWEAAVLPLYYIR